MLDAKQTDTVDRLVGLTANDQTYQVRHQRDKVVAATQGSENGLFDPALEGLTVTERLYVAFFACVLTPAPELVREYTERLIAQGGDAEMMDFVDTPKRQVILSPLGKRFINASMDERKDIWRAQLLELKLFRVVRDMITMHEGELTREDLILEIQQRLPMENPEQTFDTLVTWGRFGELFAYREDRGVLTHE